MSGDRCQRIEDIVCQAAELAPEARRAFLDDACAGGESLRKEVESLLARDAAADGTVTTVEDLTGRTIGPYKVLARIGAGGMGVVYKARDTQLDRTVAIKVLPADRLTDADRKRRFMQEAKAVSALNHPNIVTIHTIMHEAGVECIVMEFVAGKTLAEAISKRGLPLNQALRVAIEITDAMAAAHAAGIVHRDLKPSNVMLTESGRVKVLDFGLAKLTEAAAGEGATTLTMNAETEEGKIVGTVAYMSPEQAAGRPVDARSDIFSFGSVLYEMVTGQKAFQGDSKLSILAAVLEKEPRAMSEIAAAAPPELGRIIARCLRKDVNRRSQHMSDVRLAIEELRDDSEAARLTARVTVPQGKSRGIWPTAAGACLLVAAAVVGWTVLQRGREPAHAEMVRLSPSDEHDYRDAAISPDGKFVAYVSDRGGTAELWLQQVGGSEPVQLTHGVPVIGSPTFSPDGTRIAYQFGKSPDVGMSTAVIPMLGGEPRELALRAMRARFSPDGGRIAYSWLSGLMIVPSEGGAPRAVSTSLPGGYVRSPLWLDNSHLLFPAPTNVTGPVHAGWEWFVVPVEGGKAIPTGALAACKRAGFRNDVFPDAVVGDRVLFSAKKGDQTNVWEIGIKPGSWQIIGQPRQLTFGTEPTSVGGVSTTGVVAINTSNRRCDLYFLPMDVTAGKITGPARRLTQDSRYKVYVYATRNPNFFWFRSSQAHWILKELASGKESLFPAPVSISAQSLGLPLLSRDGRRVVLGQRDGDSISVIVHSLDTDSNERDRTVCSRCGMPIDLTPDSGLVFYDPGYRSTPDVFDPKLKRSVHLLDLTTGKGRPWIDLLDHSVVARTAGDSGWVFVSMNKLGQMQIRSYLVPWREEAPPQSEWVEIAEKEFYTTGNPIYFFQGRGLMARRFDPRRRGFESQPFPVKPFPGSQPELDPEDAWDVTPTGIVFVHAEHRGSVWLMRLPGHKSPQ